MRISVHAMKFLKHSFLNSVVFIQMELDWTEDKQNLCGLCLIDVVKICCAYCSLYPCSISWDGITDTKILSSEKKI